MSPLTECKEEAGDKGAGIREYFPNSVGRIPIRVIDRSASDQVIIHDELVRCSSRLVQLRDEHDRSAAKQAARAASIHTLESKVDDLVCRLYGISGADYRRICEDLDAAAEEEQDSDENLLLSDA